MSNSWLSKKKPKTNMNDIVAELRRKKILLLAIDFDQTLLEIHTGGMWTDGVEDLLEHIRPAMLQLIDAALDEPNSIKVSIVTYSMQPWLIHELLALALSHRNTSQIIVRGNTPDWINNHSQWTAGKEEHISWVVAQLCDQSPSLDIKAENILLLDDDPENIKLAQTFLHRTFLVDSTFSLDHLHKYLCSL
ncbi:uncharacterized protein LOC115226152 [Octopus sinensis]|uniref:Uncharacterized protein LOC115226152 n=1 Tax=Octopus sinensis TaxID=2607531 RepID=A0A6P7TSY2_9MOLL|nr:uncharacterized protein LOC115226152 [Octopus sinensis]XP_036370752.1 uncharacterized protein LOC115226152 [Octopus sinensis]